MAYIFSIPNTTKQIVRCKPETKNNARNLYFHNYEQANIVPNKNHFDYSVSKALYIYIYIYRRKIY